MAKVRYLLPPDVFEAPKPQPRWDRRGCAQFIYVWALPSGKTADHLSNRAIIQSRSSLDAANRVFVSALERQLPKQYAKRGTYCLQAWRCDNRASCAGWCTDLALAKQQL